MRASDIMIFKSMHELSQHPFLSKTFFARPTKDLVFVDLQTVDPNALGGSHEAIDMVLGETCNLLLGSFSQSHAVHFDGHRLSVQLLLDVDELHLGPYLAAKVVDLSVAKLSVKTPSLLLAAQSHLD